MAQIIDIPRWVESARTNWQEYRRRQVVEVLVEAISSNDHLKYDLLLKGRTLMALAYGSTRATADIDFTAVSDDSGDVDRMVSLLNGSFPSAARKAGYPKLLCRVQRIKKNPPGENITFPTYEIRVGTVEAGTNEEIRLNQGRAINVVRIEVSFNEVIGPAQEIYFDDDKYVLAYSVHDLIAEKIRAYLQQE